MIIANLTRWTFSCFNKLNCQGQHTTEPDGEWVKFEDAKAALLSASNNTARDAIALAVRYANQHDCMGVKWVMDDFILWCQAQQHP